MVLWYPVIQTEGKQLRKVLFVIFGLYFGGVGFFIYNFYNNNYICKFILYFRTEVPPKFELKSL